ncbi:MAG: hypothetical protein N838_00830 [Thiohalocapsa sp. PB-PSB1]|nr:MAG: hypothetical protein N838_00830 [Thiohalocapsa sp. PB-PSB1]
MLVEPTQFKVCRATDFSTYFGGYSHRALQWETASDFAEGFSGSSEDLGCRAPIAACRSAILQPAIQISKDGLEQALEAPKAISVEKHTIWLVIFFAPTCPERLWAGCRLAKANENPTPVGLFFSDNRLKRALPTTSLARDLFMMALHCGRFFAFALGSGFFVKLATAYFGEHAGFFAGALEAA